ncbi:hypothetical protein [Nitrosopumilus ureiphilus]|uniref:Uncharacterized protein n=1 Tax=Nitrosopumilus ureiphilus TaxID=1470067 RepID=A0A7D5RFU2_9ARCH|nr:hypothetical protein [Nitrosopumilus ureiphilus]QLH06025.1 hypothetical protein C5F50_02225 [Nitrosopumilus ureiphilus]
MTNKIIFVVFFIMSLLSLGTVTGSLNLIQSANTLKGQGVSTAQYDYINYKTQIFAKNPNNTFVEIFEEVVAK